MELHSIWLIATIADDLLIVEGEREKNFINSTVLIG
jgi:hypothetical protein